MTVERTWESDPQKMVALMLGIPGAMLVELRPTEDTNDLLIETTAGSGRCPGCGGGGQAVDRVLEDLPWSSAGGRVSRVTWRRRQWRCRAAGCEIDVFLEHDAGVVEFCERVSAANRRFPLPPATAPPSDWRDRLEQ